MIKIDCGDKIGSIDGIADAAFTYLRLSGSAAAELVFVGEAEIRELNDRFRGIDAVTDVLSFPAIGEVKEFLRQNYPYEYDEELGAVNIGSIVICREVAARQAEEYGHSMERETGYLFLHGLLHLLGYDHEDEQARCEMRAAEENILGRIGLPREEK